MQQPPTTKSCAVTGCQADILEATAPEPSPLDDLRSQRRAILAQINDLHLRVTGPDGLQAKLVKVDAEIDRLMRQSTQEGSRDVAS